MMISAVAFCCPVGGDTVRCHEMVHGKSHLPGPWTKSYHYLLTVRRPAWIRTQSLHSCSQLAGRFRSGDLI